LTDVNHSDAEVRNCRFQDNDGGDVGGGLAIRGTSAELTVSNNTLTGNVAKGEGGAIYVDATDSDDVSLVSNIWAYSDGSSGVYLSTDSLATLLSNTGFATAGGGDFGGAASATGTNTSENPLFTSITNNADPDDDDLTLKSASPMVDSGPSDGVWNDKDGSRNDRGYTGGPGAL
jgi:predicted outer membrane repeat protein